jgi:hypothetical protein
MAVAEVAETFAFEPSAIPSPPAAETTADWPSAVALVAATFAPAPTAVALVPDAFADVPNAVALLPDA